MKKLIGYCRVSTDNQREEGTIEIQRQALLEYAEAHGHELIQIFQDNGISGATDLANRPGLVEMFNCIESRQDIDAVVIYKLDRLARDLYIQEHLIKKLQDLNKSLISIKEPDICNTDPMRKAFRQMLGIFSELEKGFICMRLSAGRLNKAKKGLYAGGSPALGYKAEGKELLIDTESVETIQRIFSLREQGHTLREIAAFLNDNSIPSPRNGHWCFQTIAYVLKNELYKGEMNYSTEKVMRQDLALI